MNKKCEIAIAALAIFLLLSLAVFRGRASRELILKQNGIPLANLSGDVLLPPEAIVASISTDTSGRLDLTAVPAGTQMIPVTLRDGSNLIFNGDIMLPTRGSRMIYRRGNQTICTTTIIYADFGLFKLRGNDAVVHTRANGP